MRGVVLTVFWYFRPEASTRDSYLVSPSLRTHGDTRILQDPKHGASPKSILLGYLLAGLPGLIRLNHLRPQSIGDASSLPWW